MSEVSPPFPSTMAQWEARWRDYVARLTATDGAHDLGHVERVVANARRLAVEEGADLKVVLPAGWLHDCITVAKDSPLRPQASRLAADAAVRLLREQGYDLAPLSQVHHAIVAHSYSTGIEPGSVEARVVQDADRLEALGAIGLLRMVVTGCAMGRSLFDGHDLFCE